MRVLVDTSVWSLALRRAKRTESDVVREFQNLIMEHRVDIIGPIRQEVLSGLPEETQFEKLAKHLAAFPDILLTQEDHITAAKFFNICRSKGGQGSNTDFLICAVAVRRQIAIFTTDKDFSLFGKYLPIALHEVRESKQANSSVLGMPRR